MNLESQMTFADLDSGESLWHNNDWETPDGSIPGSRNIATMFAELVSWNAQAIDLGAGNGNITQYMPKGTLAFEQNPARVEKGIAKAPEAIWHCENVLTTPLLLKSMKRPVHLVANPPFDLAIDFLAVCAACLEYNVGRVSFLLPTEYFQAKSRHAQFNQLGLSIVSEYRIVGRVGYYKNGQVENKRQCYDSIFEFERGNKSEIYFLA